MTYYVSYIVVTDEGKFKNVLGTMHEDHRFGSNEVRIIDRTCSYEFDTLKELLEKMEKAMVHHAFKIVKESIVPIKRSLPFYLSMLELEDD